MGDWIKRLEELYTTKNILINGKDILLHENCIYKDICWNNKSKPNRGKQWNRISFPYFGEEYNGDLMCIGLNLNEYGGRDAQNELINGNNDQIGVKKYLQNGKKKINFNSKTYRGTILWHRMAVYSNIILSNCICPNDKTKLSEVYKKIAFIEAIKCSPKGNESKPEPNMYKYCPNKILFQEINIIEPNKILILGKTLLNIFINNYNVSNRTYSKNKNVTLFKILIENKNVNIINIIHPTAHGGGKIKIYQELYDVINGN
jgi:hypothetical protein